MEKSKQSVDKSDGSISLEKQSKILCPHNPGELLKDLNEMAMLAIKNEDTESGLESLRKCEEILEVINKTCFCYLSSFLDTNH